MTNNRKPVDEVRLSLSAARRREAGTHLYERLADKDMRDRPYTPPPNVAAWLQAQADKPKGRDYDAILRAAKKAPVGYYEDAPTGIKFTGVGNGSCPKIDATASKQGVAPLAPTHSTPPHSADGGQPLPSAVTKPHGKDVDTADGPWPKRIMGTDALGILEGPHNGTAYYRSGTVTRISCEAVADSWLIALQGSYRLATESEAAQWLEQNGHKDVAAQLRVKPRDDVATGGGRVWTGILGNDVATKRACVLIDGTGYCRVRGNWHCLGEQSGEPTGEKVELFGPERDAIIAECRKAMGI